jgi:hypothetical protein
MKRAPDMATRLQRIVEDIRQSGCAEQTRLTILKKWFEPVGRLASFGLFIARNAWQNTDRANGEAAALLGEARDLLAGVDILAPAVPSAAARNLHGRVVAFQNEHRNVHWTAVRQIQNWNLFLIESGLGLCLGYSASPSEGYRLAAAYCAHYDPRYGDNLNGPSAGRIENIAAFVQAVEAHEAALHATRLPPPVRPTRGRPRMVRCRRG